MRTGCNLDRAVLGFAGLMVILSVTLSYLHSPYWLFFTIFVGLNMLQASFTGFCPAAMLFSKLGIHSGCAFNARETPEASKVH